MSTTEPLSLYAEELLRRISSGEGPLDRLKLSVARELGLCRVPSNLEIRRHLPAQGTAGPAARLLVKKPVKTRSGVTVITVVAPFFNCPHGRCIYCPGGGQSGVPQSYTGMEAQIGVARSLSYDAEKQVCLSMRRLREMGHVVDKVEIIIIGGTFTAAPLSAQRLVIKSALDGLHGGASHSIEEALKRAETASPRVSGITIETKPDWAGPAEADALLSMGVTRVEIGVQALDDGVLRLNNRGHGVEDVARATRVLRDRAFKVCYHLMPGLYGSSPRRDIEMLEEVFRDPRFRPDMLKIYPTMVIPGTPLYELWRRGEYRAYPLETMVEVLVRWLSSVPPYVRVQRVRREIPSEAAVDGAYPGNLRELVEEELRRRGLRCRCVRCREIGRSAPRHEASLDVRELRYETDGGEEVFLSYEDEERTALAGLLRLRLPHEPATDYTRHAALVRELHVYGPLIPVGGEADGPSTWQHRGIGTLLLRRAEDIASSAGYRRVVVISGVGVRSYYARHGYRLQGPYMVKEL